MASSSWIRLSSATAAGMCCRNGKAGIDTIGAEMSLRVGFACAGPMIMPLSGAMIVAIPITLVMPTWDTVSDENCVRCVAERRPDRGRP